MTRLGRDYWIEAYCPRTKPEKCGGIVGGYVDSSDHVTDVRQCYICGFGWGSMEEFQAVQRAVSAALAGYRDLYEPDASKDEARNG